jgi:uncharacterized protein with FMN-binding domain
MKKRYKVLIIIGSVIVVLVVAGVIAFSSIQNSLEALKTIEIKDVDLSQTDDGTYAGSYSAFPVTAEVSVTVKDHIITGIDLIDHIHGPDHGADAITGEVVKAQSLGVDAVSGATYSSKVILLAIEDALASGINQ